MTNNLDIMINSHYECNGLAWISFIYKYVHQNTCMYQVETESFIEYLHRKYIIQPMEVMQKRKEAPIAACGLSVAS